MAQLLINTANDCGLCHITAFGVQPLNWQDINAFSAVTGFNHKWTLTLIKSLSEFYVTEYHLANDDKFRRSPLESELKLNDKRIAVNQKIKQVINGLR